MSTTFLIIGKDQLGNRASIVIGNFSDGHMHYVDIDIGTSLAAQSITLDRAGVRALQAHLDELLKAGS